MNRNRALLTAFGALAFILLVVWMLPPTQLPVDKAAASAVRPHGPTLPPPTAAEIAAAPATFADPTAVPTGAPPLRPPLEPTSGEYGAPPRYAEAPPPNPPRPPRPPSPDVDDQTDPDAAEVDDGSRDPGFQAGYRWAERNQIESRRQCRIWAGSPREDGCRAFLREAEQDRDLDDRPDDRN